MAVKCPCGRDLHYLNPEAERAVTALVEQRGPTMAVGTSAGTWEVPRHFIALHGIAAYELPSLAKKYGFRRVGS